MEIGTEADEPVEYPIPADPAKRKIAAPEPVAVPEPEKVGAMVTRTEDALIIDPAALGITLGPDGTVEDIDLDNSPVARMFFHE